MKILDEEDEAMGKAKRKRKTRKQPSPAPQKESHGTSNIKKVIAVLSGITAFIAVCANITGILGYFGLSPTNGENPTGQNPTPPSYVLYENPPDLTWSSALYSQGMEAYDQNNYTIASERFEAALAEYERISHADMNTAKIQYAIGILNKRLGNLNIAIQWYSDTIGTLEYLSSAETDLDKLGYIYNELGYVHYLRGFAYLKDRDLSRALSDCNKCSEILEQDIEDKGYFSTSLVLYLRGEIYTASYYGTHSPYPVHGGTDLGVTWLDAMSCFESALQYKGAQLTFKDDLVSNNVIVVNAYNDYGISLIAPMLQYNGKPVFSTTPEPCYIIHGADVETAVILTQRAELLSMLNTEDSLTDAIENCNAALSIYDDLSTDKREGIQETYWQLAYTTLAQGAIQNNQLSVDTIETFRDLMEKGLNYTKEWYGESYETAVAYENMGCALMLASRYNEAAEDFEKAKSIFVMLGLEDDVKKQNDFLETVAKIVSDGDTDGWEIYLTDDFNSPIQN